MPLAQSKRDRALVTDGCVPAWAGKAATVGIAKVVILRCPNPVVFKAIATSERNIPTLPAFER